MHAITKRTPLYASAACLAGLALFSTPLSRPASAANLVAHSERLELWSSWRNAKVTPDATTAPDGSRTADAVVDNASLDGARMMGASGPWPGGGAVFSVYLKSGTLGKAVLAIRNGVNGRHVALGFVTLNGSWQRFWVRSATLPAGATLVPEIHAGAYDRDNGFVYAWGAQLEPGSSPTAYEGLNETAPTPNDTTPPTVPGSLSASLSSGKVVLGWSPSSGAPTSYRIERSVNSATAFSQLATVSTPGYTDAAVSTGNTYGYRVKAVDAAGNVSGASNTATVTVTTTVTAPPPPTNSGALNVVNYGASTADGNDDSTAIQKAFDAAVTQGKDVYFPAGHYDLSRTVVFRASGRSVFGDGMTKSIIAGNTSSITLLRLEKTQNSVVRDLRFDGSLVNSQHVNIGRAVECYLTVGTMVQRVHSYGTGYLVQDNSATSTTIEDSVCQDYGRIGYLPGAGGVVRRTRFVCRPSWVFEGNMNGVYVSAGRGDVLVEDNEFIHCGAYAMTIWGSAKGTWMENVTIRNNRFQDCPKAFVVAAGGDGPNIRKVQFINNTVRNCGEKSIHVGKFNGSNSDGSGLVIDGNVFEDAGNDMSIFITNWAGSAPITGVRVSNNKFLAPNKSAYYGLWIKQNGAALSDILIENNTFSDIGHYGTAEKGHCGIYVQTGTATIRGNTFTFWSNTGQSRTTEGIRMDGGARGVLVSGNQFLGNGLPNTHGFRMTSSGSSIHGSVASNLFRRARLTANGVPTTGNTVE